MHSDFSLDNFMVIIYSRGKDQPGKVANPARGQLDMEKTTESASRDQILGRERGTGKNSVPQSS